MANNKDKLLTIDGKVYEELIYMGLSNKTSEEIRDVISDLDCSDMKIEKCICGGNGSKSVCCLCRKEFDSVDSRYQDTIEHNRITFLDKRFCLCPQHIFTSENMLSTSETPANKKILSLLKEKGLIDLNELIKKFIEKTFSGENDKHIVSFLVKYIN
jgi:predicted amidophosphoribosyltransferase